MNVGIAAPSPNAWSRSNGAFDGRNQHKRQHNSTANDENSVH
jgi:hypothetical protein